MAVMIHQFQVYQIYKNIFKDDSKLYFYLNKIWYVIQAVH